MHLYASNTLELDYIGIIIIERANKGKGDPRISKVPSLFTVNLGATVIQIEVATLLEPT